MLRFGLLPQLTVLMAALLTSAALTAPAAGRLPAQAPAAGCSGPAQDSGTRAAALLATLTPRQAAGQLFMVGLPSAATDAQLAATDDAISRLHAGNVVLYGSDWSSSDLIHPAAKSLQALALSNNAGVGLFISGNQEGGQQGAFQAFYGKGFSEIPPPIAQAQGDPALLRYEARLWGTQLDFAGVNLDLAPVLDVVPAGTDKDNAPIGFWGREYGSTPEKVSTYGIAFLQGLRDAGIAVSAKHFPGLGRVTGNTDFTAEGTGDPYFSGLDDPYLQPFMDAVQAGVDFMMVSSAIYPRVGPERAMFSRTIVTDILRQGLGFNGVIITDDVGAAAAVADLTPAERALAFFHAGGDMVLTILPSDIEPMLTATLAEMDHDPVFAAHIKASVTRVLIAKDRLKLLPASC